MTLHPTFLTYAKCIYIDGSEFEFIFEKDSYYLDLGINFETVSIYRKQYDSFREIVKDITLSEFIQDYQALIIQELQDAGIMPRGDCND